MRKARLGDIVLIHVGGLGRIAAIVTQVNADDTVGLTCFPPDGMTPYRANVAYGPDEGQYTFPGEEPAETA